MEKATLHAGLLHDYSFASAAAGRVGAEPERVPCCCCRRLVSCSDIGFTGLVEIDRTGAVGGDRKEVPILRRRRR